MINPASFAKTASQAFEDVQDFIQDHMCPPKPVLPYPFLGSLLWAAVLVRKLTGVCVQNFSRLPAKNYGSWLLVLPEPGIAVSADQLEWWYANPPKGSFPVPPSTQIARTVLHELGHMKMHPHLLRPAPATGKFAPWANPKDEEQAWIYAGSVMTILMGDYARHARVTRGVDDTPRVAL
jgi:hypothetical protein